MINLVKYIFLLIISYSIWAETAVVQIYNSDPKEISKILQSVYPNKLVVSLLNDKLVIKTDDNLMQEIKQLIRELDSVGKNLIIEVSFNNPVSRDLQTGRVDNLLIKIVDGSTAKIEKNNLIKVESYAHGTNYEEVSSNSTDSYLISEQADLVEKIKQKQQQIATAEEDDMHNLQNELSVLEAKLSMLKQSTSMTVGDKSVKMNQGGVMFKQNKMSSGIYLTAKLISATKVRMTIFNLQSTKQGQDYSLNQQQQVVDIPLDSWQQVIGTKIESLQTYRPKLIKDLWIKVVISK